MPALSLQHLQMFVVLADQNTLALAAERLRITQSALTHRIREAERRLGVSLFEKSGRRLRPTAAAQILTDTARRVLADLDEAERIAAASSEGIRHVVRLTVGNYNAYHWLPDFLAWFRDRQPGIAIEIEPNAADAALDRLSEGALDIVILPGARPVGLADAVELFDDQLVVAVWPGHPFEGRAHIGARDFRDQVYLTYSLSSEPGFEADRLWAAEGASPLRKRNLGSVDAICELIKAQAGISVLSRWGISREIAAGSLIALPATQGGIAVPWRALVSRKSPAGSPARLTAAALGDWFAAREG